MRSKECIVHWAGARWDKHVHAGRVCEGVRLAVELSVQVDQTCFGQSAKRGTIVRILFAEFGFDDRVEQCITRTEFLFDQRLGIPHAQELLVACGAQAAREFLVRLFAIETIDEREEFFYEGFFGSELIADLLERALFHGSSCESSAHGPIPGAQRSLHKGKNLP